MNSIKSFIILLKIIRFQLFTKANKFCSFFKSIGIPKNFSGLVYNKEVSLIIPTYEKSGQGVHPDILYTPDGNPCFILVFTPYPNSNDKYENPSLLISSDGIHFVEEYPNSNPLVPAPPFDHNNDPDIFFYKNKWNIVYLETLRPQKQNLILLSSADRHDWISHILHTDYLNAGDPLIVSPAFINTKYGAYLFFVDISKPDHYIQFVPISDELNPDFSRKQNITINFGSLNPWHIDLLSDTNFIYMLICCVKHEKNHKKYNLYIARSRDIKTWELSPNKIIDNSYRATGIIINNDILIYYSKKSLFSAWEIGVIKKELPGFFQ